MDFRIKQEVPDSSPGWRGDYGSHAAIASSEAAARAIVTAEAPKLSKNFPANIMAGDLLEVVVGGVSVWSDYTSGNHDRARRSLAATRALYRARSGALSAEQLPALIDRATRCLAEARSSAEVLEAKAVAEAALHYAKLTKAANETQADCLRMIVRAEMRMADEVDRGQANGEVASAGDSPSVRASDNQAITYEALGIDRRRVAEWREIRDAASEVVEQAINGALSEGRAPTKSDIRNHFRVAFTGKVRVVHAESSISRWRGKSWSTIDLDPASCEFAQARVQAGRHYTIEDDGLAQDWARHASGLIHHSSQPTIVHFVEKLVASFRAGRSAKQSC